MVHLSGNIVAKDLKMDKHFLRLCSLYPKRWPHTISIRFMSLRPTSGKQDSLVEAMTYQRFLPSSVSTGNEPMSKLSKRRTLTLIRGLSKSGL